MRRTILWLALQCGGLLGCTPTPPPQAQAPAPSVRPQASYDLVAGITDIMRYQVDPSADALWDSVGTTVDKKGTENRQPHTTAEWSELRGRAVVLAEAANLLILPGRQVTTAGHEVEDAGTPGNLTAAQAQAAIDQDRAVFISFAQALGRVAAQMVKATEEHNAAALLESGAALDEVCERCHLKFWYPGQKIPPFPNEARESGAGSG